MWFSLFDILRKKYTISNKKIFEKEKLAFFIAYLKLWVDLQKRLLRWKVIFSKLFTTKLAFLFDFEVPENFLNGL